MDGRPVDGDYARFLEATLRLADVAVELPRRPRFELTLALLTACESDRVARTALAERRGVERAATRLRHARTVLAELSLAA